MTTGLPDFFTYGRFVDGTRETGVLQGESCVESCNSRSDDSDVGHVSSPLEAHKRRMHIRHEDALTGPDACSLAGRVRWQYRSRYPRRCGCR
jgi:hypothetical protein